MKRTFILLPASRRCRAKLREQQGYSLVEALVAVTILSVVFVAVVTIATMSARVMVESGKLKDTALQAFSFIEKGSAKQENGTMRFSFGNEEIVLDGEYQSSGEGAAEHFAFEG